MPLAEADERLARQALIEGDGVVASYEVMLARKGVAPPWGMDDAVARTYGFRGGLVPGVTVYAYLTRPLVEALGPPWLGRGTASVRFVRPVFEDEEVTVAGVITSYSIHYTKLYELDLE